MSLLFLRGLKKEQLEALIAEGGALDGAVMMLFKNNVTPNDETVMADLTPADFTGYAVSDPLEWGTPYIDGDSGEWALSCAPVEFRSTSGAPFVPCPVYGVGIYVPGTPNVLKLAGNLPDGFFSFGLPDQVMVVRPEIIGQECTLTVMS